MFAPGTPVCFIPTKRDGSLRGHVVAQVKAGTAPADIAPEILSTRTIQRKFNDPKRPRARDHYLIRREERTEDESYRNVYYLPAVWAVQAVGEGVAMPDVMLTAALALAELGFAVHWIRPPRGGDVDGRGKAPVDKAWQHRPWQSPAQLRERYRPGFNVGIHTGAVVGAKVPVAVIDCDDKKTLQWCRDNLPPTPLEAVTRNGGHLYYLATAGARCRAKVNGLALDIRADGGNIVIPPSVHPTGTQYQWVRPVSCELLENLPPYRAEWFPSPLQVQHSAPLPAPGTDAYRRACAYAQNTPPAVQGQGGSLTTFKLAVALVRGFCLPQEQALSVLLQEFNPRCEPPWTEPELRHKVRYAQEAGRIGMGSLLGRGRTGGR